MVRNTKEYVPSTSDIKILDTVYYLNQKGQYPLPEGVYKILSGSSEPEFVIYHELSTYRTLTSFPRKKISRLILMLVRYNYLEKYYIVKSDVLCLKITDKGILFVTDYHKKHKYSFHKKNKNHKPLIYSEE